MKKIEIQKSAELNGGGWHPMVGCAVAIAGACVLGFAAPPLAIFVASVGLVTGCMEWTSFFCLTPYERKTKFGCLKKNDQE
jgi:hypothetical protein